MEYRIEEKPQLTVMGVSRKFNPETSYQKIPEFWSEMMGKSSFPLMGKYGICMDADPNDVEFDYWIADDYPGNELPSECEMLTIPGGMWAIFPCILNSLQQTNTQIWQQWLPNCKEYKLRGQYDVELYGAFCEEDPGKSYVEIWLPIENV